MELHSQHTSAGSPRTESVVGIGATSRLGIEKDHFLLHHRASFVSFQARPAARRSLVPSQVLVRLPPERECNCCFAHFRSFTTFNVLFFQLQASQVPEVHGIIRGCRERLLGHPAAHLAACEATGQQGCCYYRSNRNECVFYEPTMPMPPSGCAWFCMWETILLGCCGSLATSLASADSWVSRLLDDRWRLPSSLALN